MSFGGITVPGVAPPDGAQFFTLSWTLIEPDYFPTMGIPLEAGRDFGPADGEGAERVAILGEAAARRFWPGTDAVGRYIIVNRSMADGTRQTTPVRIVGIAGDVTAGGRRGESPLALYIPLQQHYVSQLTVLARRDGGETLAGDLQVLVTAMDRNLPVLNAQTLESQQNTPVEMQLRVGAAIAGSVGLIGLLLAAIGIYGVTAYAAARRTREIGIRLSLGASRLAVVGLVLRQGMRLVGIGATAGLILGAAAGRLLAASPMRLPPPDAAMLAGAAILFMVVGLGACYVPVHRATRVGAMDALRSE
jgi:putative ABC transport system permease protein